MTTRDDSTYHAEIGDIIIEQMGGGRLIHLMTGARIRTGTMPWRNGVRAGAEITLPYQAHDDIDRVLVTYDGGRDLYSMQGFAEATEVARFDRVYCEDLIDRFEEMTYVYLTLMPRR